MLMQRNKVVVHYGDGRLLKGYTHDFVPDRESFHLNAAAEAGVGITHEIKIADLKAVFFVKAVEGNPQYREKTKFEEADAKALHGIKIKVVFKDGEIIRGISMGYGKAKKGFFIIPIDPQSNNERIYVVASSAVEVVVGPNAER